MIGVDGRKNSNSSKVYQEKRMKFVNPIVLKGILNFFDKTSFYVFLKLGFLQV
jgi:hypothetical protein